MKISARYDSEDWRPVSARLPNDGSNAGEAAKADWDRASEIMRDRIDSRFLEPARRLVKSGYEYAGFAILALDTLVIEQLQRLRNGQRHIEGESRNIVTEFLRMADGFRDYFPADGHTKTRDCPCRPCDFYRNVRSGLVHDGETHGGWRIRYGERALLVERDGVKVVDRNLFHIAVERELENYIRDASRAESSLLRERLKDALDGICGVPVTGIHRSPAPDRRTRNRGAGDSALEPARKAPRRSLRRERYKSDSSEAE